jgi:hypothetical protein
LEGPSVNQRGVRLGSDSVNVFHVIHCYAHVFYQMRQFTRVFLRNQLILEQINRN